MQATATRSYGDEIRLANGDGAGSGAGVGVRRTVALVSADAALRQRLRVSLSHIRWQVREAVGGAEAMAQLEQQAPEVLLLDHWLPDLEIGEFVSFVHTLYPAIDLLRVDGDALAGSQIGSRHHELQYMLREAAALDSNGALGVGARPAEPSTASSSRLRTEPALFGHVALVPDATPAGAWPVPVTLNEMVGESEAMLELATLIRMVAPCSATVLIEGETGTGKEIVARALHRLSSRSSRPFVVLNCAAIPEALLEAELFGHTRGAFTGAVQSRIGRIEAANGGTLFLDEIGEMPLALQAKMLRFLECGELQRVGDNEVVRVDVRVIAATHQTLEERATAGSFRLDLYHRLAVFPIEVPALRRRKQDIAALSEHFLASMGRTAPRKRLSAGALERLHEHHWPGNVRELAHVLERATILAGDVREVGVEHIRLRNATRS